jgi:hypothetical protein
MARVVQELKPRCVLLFGSCAQRDVHEGSDVGCCFMTAHSSSVSGPGLSKMVSGIPIFPMCRDFRFEFPAGFPYRSYYRPLEGSFPAAPRRAHFCPS